MLPWIIPIIVSGSFYRWFFSDNGMLNGFLIALKLITRPIPWITSENLPVFSVIIANIWLGIPFNYILLYTGLTQLPIEILESADIDGASYMKKVFYVIFPLLKPVSISALLLGTIFTVKVFDLVWIITQGGPGDVSHLFSTLAYSWAFNKFQFGKASAVLIIMIFIVIILTILLSSFKSMEY
jgi:multiple sugar transport system permease protein